MRITIIASLILFLFASCSRTEVTKAPTFSEKDFVNVVIEIPAGTNRKIEYNHEIGDMRVDQRNGRDRVIQYLPYPGNYGFIPSTLMDEARGGDGDALDIIILSSTMPTNSIVETIPIGLIMLEDNGEIDNKLIAIPAEGKYQTIQSKTLADLKIDYPGVIEILETWFTNYKGAGEMKLLGWGDEKMAMDEIFKWQLKPSEE